MLSGRRQTQCGRLRVILSGSRAGRAVLFLMYVPVTWVCSAVTPYQGVSTASVPFSACMIHFNKKLRVLIQNNQSPQIKTTATTKISRFFIFQNSHYFLNFYLFIIQREKERNINLFFHLFMTSCVYLDGELNPQPWHIGMML